MGLFLYLDWLGGAPGLDGSKPFASFRFKFTLGHCLLFSDIGWGFFFGIVRGGLRDWMDPNPSQALKLKFTLGHCLFLCLFLYLSWYVHNTCSFCLDKFRGESGVDLLCFRRERGKLVVKMDLYILSFCISIFCGKTLCGDSFGV